MTKLSKTRWPLFRFLGKLLLRDFVVPTPRLIMLISFGSIAIVFGYLFGLGMYVFWAYNALLLLFSLIDIVLLPRRKEFVVERVLPERVDVRQDFEVQLRLTTSQPQHIHIELVDDVPVSFKTRLLVTLPNIAAPAPSSKLPIAPVTTTGVFRGTTGAYSYTAYPEERGRYVFHHLVLRYYGGLGLWKKQAQMELQQEISVYPDLSAVRGVLASMHNALIVDGSRIYRKMRSGSDFHYVRDYTEGDEPRHMNWKATARTAKLMTNEYRPERGKVVTVLLDCGRMMGIELDGQMKLDRSLEAALALASVALKQGDQVALLAFSNQMKVYVPPGKGIAHLHVLTEAVFDLKHDFVEPNYGSALIYLQRILKKRSFVVLFSDMESYLYDSELLPYMQRIRRGNPTLLLSLGDPVLYDWVRVEADNSKQAFIQSIAHKFTMDRKRYIHSMSAQGIPVLEVPADQLTLSAVNAYLELKSRDAL